MLARIKKNEKAILWLCLAFSLVLLAFFGLGWNLDQTLRSYLIILSLGAMLVYAWQTLGFSKDGHFLRGNVTRSIIAILISYAIIVYALGLILGFNRGYISFDIKKIMVGIVPTLLFALVTEYLRYIISSSYSSRRLPVVIFTTLTAVLYILIELNVSRLDGVEQIFIFICATVFPIIAREALCGFLSFRIGLLPALLFKLCVTLYPFVLPIIPSLGDYLHAVANIILAFSIYLSTVRHLQHFDDEKKQLRAFNARILALPVLIIGITLTILVSGIFHYQLIAIGSDSMRPVYARGDAVLFEKVNANEIAKDDILVFNREGTTITHRVVSIDKRNNTLYFTTRGDNNEKPDGFETSESQVLGRVVAVSHYIGFPTLWINEIFNQS